MNRAFLSALLALAALRAPAQGTLEFCTLDRGEGVDAPVLDVDGRTPLEGPAFLGQLYAGPSSATMVPVGPQHTFGTGAPPGYICDLNIFGVSTVRPGATASVQLRAWRASDGPTYEAAVAVLGHFGSSNIIRVGTGDPGLGGGPSPPGPLFGLAGFALLAGPRRAALTLPAPVEQILSLSIEAQPATQWTIYSSSDLVSWQEGQTIIIDGTGVATVQLAPASTNQVFYRAVLTP